MVKDCIRMRSTQHSVNTCRTANCSRLAAIVSEATLVQLLWLHRLLSEQEWYDFSRKFRSTFPGHAMYLEWTEYNLLRSAESHTLDGDQRFQRCKVTGIAFSWQHLQQTLRSIRISLGSIQLLSQLCERCEKHVTDGDLFQTVSADGGVSITASTTAAQTYDCQWPRKSVRAEASTLVQIGFVQSRTFLQGNTWRMGLWGPSSVVDRTLVACLNPC